MEKNLTEREAEALRWLFKVSRSENRAFKIFADDLGARARHGLRYARIKTIRELVTAWTPSKLLGVKGFGAKSLDQVQRRLRSYGLDLEMTEEGYDKLRETTR